MSYDCNGLSRFLKLVRQTEILPPEEEIEIFKQLELYKAGKH